MDAEVDFAVAVVVHAVILGFSTNNGNTINNDDSFVFDPQRKQQKQIKALFISTL